LIQLFIVFVQMLTQILSLAILVRAVLSWFPVSRGNPLVDILFQITEPVLAPIRRVLPSMGMMDLSPLVAILLLQFIGDAVRLAGRV
jgi:YggT family protein